MISSIFWLSKQIISTFLTMLIKNTDEIVTKIKILR